MRARRLLTAALVALACGGTNVAAAQMATAAGPASPFTNGTDLLTQMVAQTGRSLLAAAEGTLPRGEPTLGWRVLDGDVQIVARRNGTISARVVPARIGGCPVRQMVKQPFTFSLGDGLSARP